ncbi:hypothetical protein [Clostridium sp. YIM B02555]|uniref:hypothetical protein n=1 Tax=Clostridium sp. YIM B02555 TaxID=2911968 RepID=UPI001EED39BE|nr:hypothetical protein [Clostridium sp. YIM B02555]
MNKNKGKTLVRVINVKKFNEDMKLIEKYSDLIRKVIGDIIKEKDFYFEDLQECHRIASFILGYSNIIQKNDLISARNYLRTGIANGSTIYIRHNISKELKEILDGDKFWSYSIDKTK